MNSLAKKLLALFLTLLLVPIPGCATMQMTAITASSITDSAGNLMAKGTITFAPTDCKGNALGFHVGSGGWAVPKAAIGQITAGAITGQVGGGTFQVADTAHTAPVNVCYDVTIYDQISRVTYPTIHGVQPTGSTWSWDAFDLSTTPLGIQGGTDWGLITGTLSNQTDLQSALNLKAPLASPALTGSPTAPTQSPGDNSTKLSTTAYVDTGLGTKRPLYKSVQAKSANYTAQNSDEDSLLVFNCTCTLTLPTSALTAGVHFTVMALTGSSLGISSGASLHSPYGATPLAILQAADIFSDGSGYYVTAGAGYGVWGTITGTLSTQSDLQTALNLKAPLASPALTGSPTAPTQSPGDNSTKVSTTAYVDTGLATKADSSASTAVNGTTCALGSSCTVKIPVSYMLTYHGVPPSSTEIMYQPISVAASVTTFCAGSYMKAKTAATGSTTFTLYKNGSSFGTATFSASGTSAGFSCPSSPTSFVTGDVLEIVGGGDATLGNIGVSISATQ